jgi:septum formation protein
MEKQEGNQGGKKTMKRIILASASPRRISLLRQIGLDADVVPSDIEEKAASAEPSAVVKELSVQKCLDVAEKTGKESGEEHWVIGADTVVASDGQILGKPASPAQAAEMLRGLQGRKHQVYTGVTIALVREGKVSDVETFAEKTEVFLFPMSEEEIQEYIRTGEPFDKAGGYGIQGVFARYVEKIEGDYNNVVGLPAAAVYQRLKKSR